MILTIKSRYVATLIVEWVAETLSLSRTFTRTHAPDAIR